MSKLPIKEKVFWSNFFQCIFGIIGVVIILSGFPDLSLIESYIIVSILALIGLCGKVAMDFRKSEEIDELARKMNLSPHEFREKYKDLLEIMRK